MAGLGAKSGLSFLTLNQEEQAAIDANLSLFELRRAGLYSGTNQDFALWGCDAKLWQKTQTSNGMQYVLNWHRGQVAYVQYRNNAKGFSIGFCPDDLEWHNRIILCVIPESNTIIDRFHSQSGVRPGAELRAELDILRSCINDWALIDNDDPFEKNKIITRGKTFQEMDEQYKILVRKNPSMKDRYQVLECKIEPIEALKKISEHGWMFLDEFQKGMRPAIEEQIKRKLYSKPVLPDIKLTPELLLSMVDEMTTEQRMRLAGMLSVQSAAPINPEPPETIQDANSITLDEVRVAAAKLNIATRGKRKADLLEEIRIALAQRSMESAPEITSGENTPDENTADIPAEEEVFN